MCNIFFAYKNHPKYRLIVAANRDEFYERGTAHAGIWGDAPQILAGRDLKNGGTWLGVTKTGRFAAVTNYRDPFTPSGELSRGLLVSEFLKSTQSAEVYLKNVALNARNYSGFNLLVSDLNSLFYFSNRGDKIKELDKGVYGLSNHLLNTPWRKVERGKEALKNILIKDEVTKENLFNFLADQSPAKDSELPDTGIGIEKERILSPIFIVTPIYGTRSSTVLLIDEDGGVEFSERTFRNGFFEGEEVNYNFKIEFNALETK